MGLGLVVSCNLFNPDGTGAYPDDPDALIDLGQRDLQAMRFGSAWTRFSTALALDSTKSMAYQGLAKAEMGRGGFSMATLVELAEQIADAPDSAKLGVLAATSQTDLNHTYRPLLRTAALYKKLRRRDSLGRTDGIFPSRLILNELNTILSTQAYFRLLDGDGDTLVTASELNTLRLVSLTMGGGLRLDPRQILDPAQVDANGTIADSTVANLNGILNSVAGVTRDTAMLREVRDGIAADSGVATAEVSRDALDFIAKLGTSLRFYQVNDSLDNDGDGCFNEEIYGDSLDNDADSLIEEDARIGFQASKDPVAGNVSMVSPSKYALRHVVDASGDLTTVARTPDDLVWADASGRLRPWASLRWIRWDAPVNDSIYRRVLRENGFDGAEAPQAVKASGEYGRIRAAAIAAVREKVLAKPADRSRVAEGKLRVGGCWDGI